MSLKLAGYLFTGPFPIATTEVRANQVPVIFAIIAKGGQSWAPVFRVIDVGASPDEGMRFADHQRSKDWKPQAGESVGVYLFYAARSEHTASDRKRISPRLCVGNTIRLAALCESGFVADRLRGEMETALPAIIAGPSPHEPLKVGAGRRKKDIELRFFV